MAYTRTNWEDYPSTDTPINANNLNNIEDGIEEALDRNILCAGLTNDISLTSDGTKIATPNKTILQVGSTSKLYLSTNGLYIGEGVNHIMISAMLHAHIGTSTTQTAYNMMIYKNGEELLTSMNSGSLTGINHTKTISPSLVEVQQGDYFQFAFYGRSGDYIGSNTKRTYMTVEVID